ncbi:hypothetical protein BDV38DRAFT_289204 [Aspergillus pseudotamarii]|uniref:Rhodopsin domain-containing protein n=1 Tax=Aspergillus pseudotamarii TaxID=132259 RepID=A0A5N6SB24_ASPPS|nr:uncharacterized protein BDV38DRAFT_289204 [Aspergillus pseudotamarii]KAE8130890.1 hypothetical protein BDV38DRAFT_289204 [Aspergillus pseudotamarii]
MQPFAREVAIESWILYAIGILIIGCRLASRRILLKSWMKLQMDDALMCLIAITFTGLILSMNSMAQVASNPIVHEENPTPHAVALMVWGNKMIFIVEQFALSTIWLVKGCLLIVYNRLTLMTKEHSVVKIVTLYVVVSFLIIEILFLGVWCQPISEYFNPFTYEYQCGSYLNHLITTTILNISSDLLMLGIPLPLFIRSQLPLKKKIAVCAVFSLGGIVILMATLNKYYNFIELGSPRFLKWYAAEVSTAVYVANMPLLWPLLRQTFNCRTATRTGVIALAFAISSKASDGFGQLYTSLLTGGQRGHI